MEKCIQELTTQTQSGKQVYTLYPHKLFMDMSIFTNDVAKLCQYAIALETGTDLMLKFLKVVVETLTIIVPDNPTFDSTIPFKPRFNYIDMQINVTCMLGETSYTGGENDKPQNVHMLNKLPYMNIAEL